MHLSVQPSYPRAAGNIEVAFDGRSDLRTILEMKRHIFSRMMSFAAELLSQRYSRFEIHLKPLQRDP